jgi:MSHA pilin protein MshD
MVPKLSRLLLKQGLFMRHKHSGITLVELILSMVIISIALTGVLSVMNLTVSHSADPVIQHQAIAVAESYLEEVLLQSYDNPANGYSGADRSQFDDVDDYNGLSNTGVKEHLGNAVATLAHYDVSVSVATAVTLAGGVLAKKITVAVSSAGISLNLVGYRAND